MRESIRILGTGSFAPKRVVSNADIVQKVATSDEWIQQNLGIRERRVANENEFTSDLAAHAAQRALEDSGVSAEEIDLLLVTTATPDRKAPSTACLVKNKLGIRNHCAAWDLSAVCSGFVYGLHTAANLIAAGAHKKVLLIGADTFSKITDWTRRNCVFFGDGAGAVILGTSDYENALFDSNIYSECQDTDSFTVFPYDKYFTMDGKEVYRVGTKVLPEAILSLLNENELTVDDVTTLIPHQPSIKLLLKTAETLQIPLEKLKRNMDRYANTSSATIPLLLDEVARTGELKQNDLVVFAAVGSGWTWGAALYRWH